MFGFGLLVIFGIVPALLILASDRLAVEGRLWLLFVLFPVLLLITTLIWDRRRAGE